MLKKTLFLSTIIFCLISFTKTSYSKENTKAANLTPKNTAKKTDATPVATAPRKESLAEKIDRLEKKIDQMGKRSLEVKKLTKSKPILTFAKYWGYPIYHKDHNGNWRFNRYDKDKKIYSGISVSSTSTNGFWRFGTTFLVSKSQEISYFTQVLPDPEDLSSELVEIESSTKIVEWIVTPNLSFPVFKRKFWKNKFFASNLELRLGVAYELHFTMEYQKNDISVLYISKKTVIFPTDFSNKTRLTGISTLDFNIRALHLELDVSANTNGARLGLGIGAKW